MKNIVASARHGTRDMSVMLALELSSHFSTRAKALEAHAEKERLVLAALRNPGMGIYGAKATLRHSAEARLRRLDRKMQKAGRRKMAAEGWLRSRGLQVADQHLKSIARPVRLEVVE